MALTSTTPGSVSLDAVLRTDDLSRRPGRPADYGAENRALAELAETLANEPRAILQKLAEVAKATTGADSAGISLLSKQDGGRTFYWPAVTGPLSPYVGEGTPRDFGPCGVVLDQDAVQLFAHPENYYPYLAPITPPLEEILLTPFHVQGKAVGTIWLVSHTPQRKFDQEDARLIASLGTFAAAAYQVLEQLDQLECERAEGAKARLAAIVESSDDAIVSKSLDGIITSWNRGAERIFGYTASEAIGQPVTMLIPLDRADEEPGILQRIRRGEKVDHYETIRRRKDGRLLAVSLSVSPLFNAQGRIVGASKIARDITDRKQADQRLRLLWEAAAILLSTDNPDTMMRGLFAKVRQHLTVDTYFNYLVNDAGDALRMVSCHGIPDETARSISRLEFGQAICGNVALYRQPIVATRIQESDDPKVQLVKSFGIRAYACNPLIAENRLIGTLSFASHTKESFEPDEVAFFETLCHYVTMAYERLRLVERLQEADRRKDEFLATLAHELRNPLAPVRNALELLQRAEGDRAVIVEACGIMERQVSQMVRLVDDLLDVARITRDKMELRKSRIELSTVVRNAVEASRPLIEQMGHELTVTLPPQPVYLDADPVRLTQVFLNLLNNAAKYTEKHGRIWLTAAVETAEREHPEVVVRVKDTGVGIPADKLPHVFDLFTQVERSLDRSQGGLGLGLTLVKRLTEMHGGNIRAVSEGAGRGSEFTVHLPIAVGAADGSSPAATNGTASSPRHRLLVVDDNRDGADSLAMMLRLLGNRVQTAYDGIEAVQMAEGFRPDVVLLDIGLPKLNGYETSRRIRSQPWGQEMVLIAVTGWGQDEDKRRAQEAGFDIHMVKPVSPVELEKVLAGLTATSA